MIHSSGKTILVVDDERLNINILVDLLDKEFTVLVAKSGEQALKRAHGKPAPDLILLDIMMPGMNGYEVLDQLQKSEATRDVPVIFVSALGQSEDETRGFKLGAVDYISKPFCPEVVRARVHTHLSLREAYRNLKQQKERLDRERNLIEEIILTMRHAGPPLAANIATLMTPVEKTAGDIILSATRPDGVLHLLLGDFTGHGLPAAIGGPMVDELFLEMTARGESPEEILGLMNRKLHRRLPADIYMAALFLEWHKKDRKLCLWNYAMPDILIFRDGGLQDSFISKDLPLGVVAELNTRCHAHFQAQAGDRIYASSDGVIETPREGDQELFGMERLVETLGHHSIDKLQAQLDAYRGSGEQTDDITLVELTCQ
ncbi:MAG: fused response regulator/phosphatase [Magnetococcales bacterium]|nr:fused response regulator/phosphatase [Magnetococcales bacterium]